MDFLDRLNSYNETHCWQYDIRLRNFNEDINSLPWWVTSIDNLKISDFVFLPLLDDKDKELAGKFIKKHEWLGNLALNTTNYFGAFYMGVLAGVVTIGVPTAFSKLLGDDTKDVERLISRGACISWSPKGLASALVMYSIRWMVKNTQYRLFTAYSDPTAKELGTIYQACNFYYLGNNFGASKKYLSPYSNKLISDRTFRSRSYYKRYAHDLGILWGSDWSIGDKILWSNVPTEVAIKLKTYSKEMESSCKQVLLPSKHKYAYVLGKDKKETKLLRRKFLTLNKIYDYPKVRGE